MRKMVKCPECNSLVDATKGACSECGYPFDNIDELEIVNDGHVYSEKQRLESERRIAELENLLQAEKKQLESLSNEQANNPEVQDAKDDQVEIVIPEDGENKEDANNKGDSSVTKPLVVNNQSEPVLEAPSDHRELISDNNRNIAEQIESIQINIAEKKTIPKSIIIGAMAIVALLISVIILMTGKPVESIELKNQSEEVSEGYDLQLKATIIPDDAKNKNLTWRSSDENIATVDSEGTVNGVNPGECVISVQSNNKKEASCKITVGAVPRKIEFEKDSFTMTVNSKGSVDYKIEPENVLDDSVTWKSSDDSIVSVDAKGQLTANKSGAAEISITTFNGVTDTCNVSVYIPTPTPKPSPTPVPKSPLETVYDIFCDPSYAKLGSDGSYLLIDTKPNDNESDESDEAIQAIASVLYIFEFPESVIYKIDRTNALAGIQSEVHNHYKVSWSYHPDKGLEALFEII